MEIGQLEAFVAIAREGSFTRAAERLTISQPSLSERIRRLEQSLGKKMIHRRSRPVTLTAVGKAFLPYAERALAILTEAGEMVRTEGYEWTAQIKVGCPFSVATYLMPEVVDRFSQAFPQAELYIETGNSEFVVSQLVDGLVNLAFAAAFPKFLDQTQTLLRLRDHMAAAVAPRHGLAGKESVSLNQIWPYRMLLIHWGAAFQAYVESLRQMSDNPGPIVRLPLAGALPMARQLDTVTFMPRRLVAASGLAELRLRDFDFAWDITLMTRPGHSLTGLEREFVSIAEAVWRRSEPAD